MPSFEVGTLSCNDNVMCIGQKLILLGQNICCIFIHVTKRAVPPMGI